MKIKFFSLVSELTFYCIFLTCILLPAFSFAQVIAGGGYHSLAVCNDGTVRSWGEDGQGQLGDNVAIADKSTAVTVSGLSGITAVAAGGGDSHSLALKNDGTVWSWGDDSQGQLGDDAALVDQHTPVAVSGLTGTITAISAGVWSSFALKSDGTVWSWGWNGSGQLGDNTITDKSTPVQVRGSGGVGFLTGITAISGGKGSHTLALKSDGTVWSWGDDDFGQLGDDITLANKSVPVPVNLTGTVVAIASGWAHSLALKSDGTVWSWGYDNNGQLGNNVAILNQPTPVQVSGLINIIAIAAGGYHSLALKGDGTIMSWGNDGSGQLGDDVTLADQPTPVAVSGLTGITGIAGGWFHSLAVKNDGNVWSFGYDANGQLGDDAPLVSQPVPVWVTPLCPVTLLPIELLYFNAFPENNSLVRCVWTTASETNNDYFTIERSKNGSIFEPISTLKGAGNSSAVLNYVFYDEDPYSGLSYYRLKQTDFDGQYSYSYIRSVYIGKLDIITIYPNPGKEYIQYEVGSKDGGTLTVKVMDVLGREVVSSEEEIKKGITTKQINTSGLSAGSYLLQINTNPGSYREQEKVQKQFLIK